MEAPVKHKWIPVKPSGKALGEVNLVDVPGGDVFLGFPHRIEIPVLGKVGLKAADRRSQLPR
jgi:hypothetical protein